MTDPITHLIGLALATIVVLASGVWLTRTGKPYGTLALNVHKLVTVGAIAFAVYLIAQAHDAAPLSALQWTAAVAAGALVLAVIVTGGVVTAMTIAPAWALWFHRAVSWLAAALVAIGLLVSAGCASPAPDDTLVWHSGWGEQAYVERSPFALAFLERFL